MLLRSNLINLSTILLGLKIICLNGPKINPVFVKSTLLLPHKWVKDQFDFCSSDSFTTVLLESSCYQTGNILDLKLFFLR